MDQFDLGDAPSALDMPRHRLAEELSKRGLKPSGFPADDARRLQTYLDSEWEATKIVRLQEAREAYVQKRKLQAIMAGKAHEELQLREEGEAVAKDVTAAFYLRLIRDNATPPTLCFRSLTPPAMRACVKALGSNTSLQALDLTGCGLDDDSIGRALAAMLTANTRLARLDLDMNNLTAGGAACLAEGLAGNKTLIYLGLEGNPLCVRGGEIGRGGSLEAAAAAEAKGEAPPAPPLPGSPDFSGFQALASAVAAHPALETLNVFDCGLGREGGSALSRALGEGCPTLRVLAVSPTDGCHDSDLRVCMGAVRRNNAAVAEALGERLARESLAVRASEVAAAAAAQTAAKEAAEEWSAAEAARRAAARKEAEFARQKEESMARAKRAAEYKEYLAAKEAAEKEKEAKAKK
jgi:hypothetical protein